MNENVEILPRLTRGVIAAVNETYVTVDIPGRLGTITAPLRWVFTDRRLAVGQTVEFYYSYMKTIE